MGQIISIILKLECNSELRDNNLKYNRELALTTATTVHASQRAIYAIISIKSGEGSLKFGLESPRAFFWKNTET
jgi:hypothetical protein